MGFISNIQKILSGETQRDIKLIRSNMMRVLQKTRHLDENDLTRIWVSCAVAETSGLVKKIFFEEWQDDKGVDTHLYSDGTSAKNNPFKQHSGNLTPERVFEFFKLTAGSFLVFFLEKEDNISLLNKVGLTNDTFRDIIFVIFEFNAEDKKTYEELRKQLRENPAGYFITLDKRTSQKVLGVPSFPSIITSYMFGAVMNIYFQTFSIIFKEATAELRRQLFFSKK